MASERARMALADDDELDDVEVEKVESEYEADERLRAARRALEDVIEEKQRDVEKAAALPPKLALALVPFDAVELVAAVLEAPCTGPNPKYELRDWEKGMSWDYCTSALLRHLVEWFQHRRHLDRSDGLPAIAHVAARALMLTAMELRGVGDDDRPGSSER